jgi:hypothetical protein
MTWPARRVSALLQDAYDTGDALLRKRSTYTEIVQRLQQSHPGFSEKTYEDTISIGCFGARCCPLMGSKVPDCFLSVTSGPPLSTDK